VSVTSSAVSVPVLKAIEAGVVTCVRSATTVSRAACRVNVTRLAVNQTSVGLTSVSAMTMDSVLARWISHSYQLS